MDPHRPQPGPQHRIHQSSRRPIRLLLGALSAALLISLMTTGVASAKPGGPFERGDDFPTIPPRCYDYDAPAPIDGCRVVIKKGRPTVVLWGDSHAWQYLSALRKLAKTERMNLVVWLAGGCPPAVPRKKTKTDPLLGCERQNNQAMRYLKRMKKRGEKFRLVTSGWWVHWRRAYDDWQRGETEPTFYRQQIYDMAAYGTNKMFSKLGRFRIPTDIIGQTVTVPADRSHCFRGNEPYQCTLTREEAMPDEAVMSDWEVRQSRKLHHRPRIISSTHHFCTEFRCDPKMFGHPDVDTFFDDEHISASAAGRMTADFEKVFKRLR